MRGNPDLLARRAAADALGKVGTLEALLALKEARLDPDYELQLLAKRSAESIRARYRDQLEHGQPGRLSVAPNDPREGALSSAEQDGELSVPAEAT